MRLFPLIGVGVALMAACHNPTQVPAAPPLPQVLGLNLQLVASGLSSPIDLQAPTGDKRLFIAERRGTIRVIDENGAMLPTAFLDLSSRILPLVGEGGLLSFTFDPNFSTNGFVWVHFTENNLDPNGDIVVERYTLSADPNVLDPATATPIIRIAHHEANNHYGGRVMFGPDGMFYISTGDGGGANNQFRHAQDANSLLGKLLRIDVSALHAPSPNVYDIPADNPAWDTIGRNEVWAIGLRNPFRPAFDFVTGFLYIADVGQDQREEVDVAVANGADAAGLNYGWNLMEGSLCFSAPCDPSLIVPPYEYTHTAPDGGCAIIGGYVYRGSAMPTLKGLYFFSDLCKGFVRALLALSTSSAIVVEAPGVTAGGSVQSIGQDGAGELYILTDDGRVQKIVNGS